MSAAEAIESRASGTALTHSLFLSAEELAELTGFKLRSAQLRWLDAHRWRYALARNRQPRVARAYFLQRMGALAGQFIGLGVEVAAAALEQPDFSALNRSR